MIALFLLLLSAPASVIARVAQRMERWSYKPEVEGLNPSLGTKSKEQEQQAGAGAICHMPFDIFHLPFAFKLPFKSLSVCTKCQITNEKCRTAYGK